MECPARQKLFVAVFTKKLLWMRVRDVVSNLLIEVLEFSNNWRIEFAQKFDEVLVRSDEPTLSLHVFLVFTRLLGESSCCQPSQSKAKVVR